MKKKILVVDNTIDPPHGSPEICAHLRENAGELGEVEVVAVRGPEGKIPSDFSGYAGVVLSGSKTRIYENAPWIDQEIAAIKKLHDQRIPTLGICFGEQLIVRALGGGELTGVSRTSEHGWAEIEVNGESKLLAGLPTRFHSFEAHYDEVYRLPPGFRLTASSVDCPVQAFEAEGKPMWGIQFHPERSLEQGNQGLDRRIKENPQFRALNRDRADKVFDPSVAKTIFGNFLRMVWKGGDEN